MITHIISEAEVNHARAATYTFLSTALRYPDVETLRLLSHADRFHVWMQALHRWNTSFMELAEPLHDIVSSWREDFDGYGRQMQTVYAELFGHTLRGTCPPYELEYDRHDVTYQASELADLAGFYEAFGLRMTDGAAERVDHAGVECEFMSVLAARQAYALECSSDEALKVLREAQQRFLTDHLGRWFPAFATRLQESNPDGFYGLLGKLAGEFLVAECQLFDAPCGPQ